MRRAMRWVGAVAAMVAFAAVAVPAGAGASTATWTALAVPAHTRSMSPRSINDIACPSSTRCTVVGQVTAGSGYHHGVAAEWTGSSWSTLAVLPAPGDADPGGFAFPLAVACPSTTLCWVVGGYQTTSSQGQAAVARWTPTGWSDAQSVEAPGDANVNPLAYLSAIACPSTTLCVAIGHYSSASSGSVVPMLTTWTPRFGWSQAQSVTLPSVASTSAGGYLTSVACTTTSVCFAVGFFTNVSGVSEAMVSRWAFSSGVAQAKVLAVPGDQATSGLVTTNSIRCVKGRHCLIVGRYVNNREKVTSFAWRWTPTSSKGPFELPYPADHVSSSSGGVEPVVATCGPVVTTCIAVLTHGDDFHGYLDVARSTSTGVVDTPLSDPAGSHDAQGNAVACPTVHRCFAAGGWRLNSNAFLAGVASFAR